MLFKRNNRSFKFCLLGLESLEYLEITRLIQENGGEVSKTRNSPVITFSTCNVSFDDRPVFHVNYIYECLKRGELLDLVPFKFGCQEFAGCLMSIFIYGTNHCPFINDTGPCCSSTATELSKAASPAINREHNYAHGDYAAEQETTVSTDVQPTARNSPLRDSEVLPDATPSDSEFLPDGTPRDSEVLPDATPRDSEFLPDSIPKDSEFLPDGTPSDSEFLPEGTPRDSEFLPDCTPRDSEFLPDCTPRDSEFLPDCTPRDSEFLPASSSQTSVFSPASTPQRSEFLPDELPPASQFPPHELPQNLQVPPDESSQNPQIQPDRFLQKLRVIPDELLQSPRVPPDEPLLASELPPDGSRRDSEFPADDSPQISEFTPCGSPRDSEFLPDGSQPLSELPVAILPKCSQSLSSELSRTLKLELQQNCQVLSDESMSSIGLIVPESPDLAPFSMEKYPMLQIPEPAHFEELGDFSTYNPEITSPCETWVDSGETTGLNRSVSTPITSPRMDKNKNDNVNKNENENEDENVCRQMNRTCSQDTIIIVEQSPKFGTDAHRSCPSDNAGEETECEEDIPRVKVGGLRVLRTSKLFASQRAISPIFGVKKTVRKVAPTKEETGDSQRNFSSKFKTSVSPTILKDESNRVKILGRATSEALRNVENFLIDSSDSDETNYQPSPATNDRECQGLEDQSLSSKIQELNNRIKGLKKNGEIAGPSRERNTSEDTEDTDEETAARTSSRKASNKRVLRSRKCTNGKTKTLKRSIDMAGPSRDTEDSEDSGPSETESVNDNKKTGKENWVRRTSEKNTQSSRQLRAVRGTNDDKNTMVSSTRSSDDVVSISSNDSNADLSSEDEEENLPSRKVTHNKTLPKKTTNQTQSQATVKKRPNRPMQLSRNFLPWEQREMVKYLIDNNYIAEARGIKVWKQMIHDGYLVHRTHQSLNNHFRKTILPNIHVFPMKPEILKKFRRLCR